jgi:hypothetical protein
MKTMNNIFKFILATLAVVTFFSCDIPVSLGAKLDIQGPVVTITSPPQRKSVPVEFDLTGTASDDSGVERMLVKAFIDNKDFPKQWRYEKGEWQISNNSGSSWSAYPDASWEGTNKSGSWKIPIDMNIIGTKVEEGEYTFSVQAWDKGDFTDDNSYKAIVLVIDLNPPKADVSFPFLYRDKKAGGMITPAYTISPLKELHDIPDDGPNKEYEDPAFLGKFLTQEFDLKWQVDDMNDVYSIDLRFYDYATVIDDDPTTPLPETYYYKFTKNIGKPPTDVNPDDYIKPNGTVTIPDLAGQMGTFDQGGILQASISTKTTVKVVAVCYDAAGNGNQEKTLGYFIFWPRANLPWITFTDGMNPPVYSPAPGSDIATLETKTFTVFPSKKIKATAYQAYGVKKVEYSVYGCTIIGAVPNVNKGNLTNTLTPVKGYDGTISNIPYSSGMYSTIFAWDFEVPPLTGYYVVKAIAYSNKDEPSKEYEMLFIVNDITFPDFPSPPQPAASEPLYLAMNAAGTQFTISGTVGDATGINSLCLVWINPVSKDAAANAQLTYFREPKYVGWDNAIKLPASGEANGQSALDGTFDSANPNKLWKLDPKFKEIDPDTNRRIYTFQKTINISDLNINSGANPQPLRSQMFLFRAENPVDKCTIITYAPQGDTSTPVIKIDNVVIRENTSPNSTIKTTCYPNTYTVLPMFANGNTINITGKWKEDSVKQLNLTTFFKNYFEINVNNTKMNHLSNQPALTLTSAPSTDADGTWDGTWTLSTTVGTGAGQVPLANLKDTLVIDVKTKDIGGNVAQLGSSWLIKSDKLQLMRISSDKSDDTYKTGEIIEIFLEFSKPVKLNENFKGEKTDIQLILSSGTNNTARAKYKDDQKDQNSRQYFVYEVGAGDNTTSPEYLNVIGLYYNGTGYPGVFVGSTLYNQNDYPFAWSRGARNEIDGDFEEVRLTMQANKDGGTAEGAALNQYYARTLPTNTSQTSTDYQFTLYAAKHIIIDTTPPKITAISTTTPSGYYKEGDIYFTITFDEPVKLGTGAQPNATPRFPLRLDTSTVLTSSNASDVRVNDKTITFKYTIVNGNTSNGRQVYVSASTNMTGNIYDIAGNSLAAAASNTTGNGLAGLSETQRTLSGIYIETVAPGAPTVRVLTAQNTSSVISQTVGNNTITGESGNAAKNLTNIYQENLWLAIQGNTTGDATPAYKCEIIEYSIDDGVNWLRAPNYNNTPFPINRTGDYKIRARQIDKAGNISANTNAVNFNWKPGNLLTRISSTNANGVYTHTTGRDQIAITLNFKESLYFSGSQTITLNARDKNNSVKTIPLTPATNPTTSLTFNYNITDGDYTPTNPTAYLDITNISITAWDGGANNTGVNVSTLINNSFAALSPTKLDSTKQFTVETGALTNDDPVFAADSGTEGNDNFHGIRSDDGSYWTTLQITFNHKIIKNIGNITITQNAGSGTTAYRLPAVLTETQYNRFKGNSLLSGSIDTYYIKGTNGFKYNSTTPANSESDTSTKYILQYNYNPDSRVTTNNSAFTGDTFIPSAFFTNFRNAEAISININAQAVTLSNDDKTLNIRLTGSSAPQVPGAAYTVALPDGLVTDSLGNSFTASTYNNVSLRGVAKPFVRVRKSQDTIATGTAGANAPRLVATQPMQSYARMDCRTPNATITYAATTYKNSNNANVTAMNWGTGVTGTGNAYGNANTYNGPQDTADGATRPTGVAANAAYGTTYSDQITLGDNPAINSADVQGYQWWVRAKAQTGTGGSAVYSAETEEKAYRTVITLQVRNNNGAITSNDNEAILANGDQIWIRGGDAIGSSSIPGFPFTWEDNWNGTAADWKNKRAGIRLMSKTNTTDSLNNSEWKFVTWEINTTAYVDFIMGHDTASSVAQAWQYGPQQSAYQRSGWTSFKDKYPVYPGKHRWCDMGQNWSGKYAMNFSKTFHNRPTAAPFDTADNTTYDLWPGINTK